MLPGLEQRLTGRVCLRIMPPCSFKLATDSTVPVEKIQSVMGGSKTPKLALASPPRLLAVAAASRIPERGQAATSGSKTRRKPSKNVRVSRKEMEISMDLFTMIQRLKKGFNLRNSEFNHIKPQVHQQKTRFLPKHGGVSAL